MSSAVIGSLRVNLGIDSAQFTDGLRKAQQSLAGIGKSMTRVGAGMSAAITAPIVAFGTSIVRTAGDFEASMSRVGAATGAAGDQLASLETMARELGKTTIFSASEASDAMEVLAKNGLSVEQILGGATQASLDLAAATGSDMSSAADVATDVMLSFGKQASELQTVVDGITGTLMESKFGFDDYRLAIGQAGGVAGGLGVEFEDFNAALVATSNLFASGSDAGTSFKTFLQRLVPQSKEAATAMSELGLEFFDAQGSMKSMEAIAEELRTGLSGLSEEAKTAALTDIFGTDAMRTAIGLAGTTAERFREIQTVLSEASGAEQAAARLGPFNAAMEQLGGAFEELQLAIAKSGLIEFITSMIGKLTEMVTYLAETNPALLQWGTVIAGLAAILGPAVIAIGLLVTGIAAIGAPIALAIAAVAAITAGMIAFKPEIIAVATAITSFLSGAWAQFAAAWDGMVAKVHAVKQTIIDFAASIPAIFQNLAAQMTEIGAQIIQGLWDGLKSKMAAVKDSLAGFATGLVDSVRSTLGIQSPSKVMHEVGTNIMQGLGDGMTSMQGGIESIASSIGSTISGAFKSVIDGSKTVKEAIGDVLKSLAAMLADSAFKSLTAGLFGGGGGGGFFASLFGGLTGFARGGTIMPGGSGGIDSQVVAFRKSPSERVDITKPGQRDARGGGIADVRVFVDQDGNWHAAVERISRRTATGVTQAGIAQYDKGSAGRIGEVMERNG